MDKFVVLHETIKEWLLKNTVLETVVIKESDGDGIETPYEEWLTLEDTEIPFVPENLGFKEGDKVRVIIVKEKYDRYDKNDI